MKYIYLVVALYVLNPYSFSIFSFCLNLSVIVQFVILIIFLLLLRDQSLLIHTITMLVFIFSSTIVKIQLELIIEVMPSIIF